MNAYLVNDGEESRCVLGETLTDAMAQSGVETEDIESVQLVGEMHNWEPMLSRLDIVAEPDTHDMTEAEIEAAGAAQ